MFHLIKLELRKGRLHSYLWGSLIAYGIIACTLMLLYFIEGTAQVDPIFQSYIEMLQVIDITIRATFIVYASVLLSKLIINEFKDKTMALLFTYPISRKKLIFAKLSIVFVWVFANVFIANLIIDTLLIAIDSGFGYLSSTLTSDILVQHAINVVMQAFGAAGMSLLPLAFGMRKKSVPATIVSSILIVTVVCSNNMGFALSSIIAIPLSLAAIGILICYLSFRNIDRVDVS